MFTWIKRAVSFVKGLASTYSALKSLQLQTKDATIQMQREHIDLLSDHLSVNKEVTDRELEGYTKKLEEVETSKKQLSEATLALAKILHEVLTKVVPEVSDRIGKYANARARLTLALRITAYRQERLRQGSDSATRLLTFIRDMDLFAAQEIKIAAQQLIDQIDQGGPEEGPEVRSFLEKGVEWATREEERLSKTHTLPPIPRPPSKA